MKIAVVGAGITGLTLAYYLKKKNFNVSIFEKSSRLGGSIQTIQQNGFLFELGPRSCRPEGNGTYTLHLIEELNLCEEVIHADKASKKRFIFQDQRLHELPINLITFFKSSLLKGSYQNIFKEFFLPKAFYKDESVHSFFTRRFGESISSNIIDPFVNGIFAGDPRQLSLKASFPKIFEYEKNYGSVLKGLLFSKSTTSYDSPFIRTSLKKGLFSFKMGMETLIQGLEKNLKDEIHLQHSIHSIQPKNKKVLLTFNDQTQSSFDHLILAIPCKEISSLLNLNYSVPQASLIVASLGFNQQVTDKKGFGYLIPHHQQEPILGMVWDSFVFPEQNLNLNQTRFTAMLGGMRNPTIIDKNEDEIKEIILKSLEKHLEITQLPDHLSIHKYHHIIPQYHINHLQKITMLEKRIKEFSPNISLAGNNFYGISVNDCIANSMKLAETFSIKNKA